MSERGLVVHQSALSSMESALADATTSLPQQIDDLLQEAERLTPGWEASSESHAAHLEYPDAARKRHPRWAGRLLPLFLQ